MNINCGGYDMKKIDISIPIVFEKIANIGVNAFISGIGTIFISYFIINIIWVFLE